MYDLIYSLSYILIYLLWCAYFTIQSNPQEMSGEYEEKKAAYENLAAGLESNMSKLEQVRKCLNPTCFALLKAFLNCKPFVLTGSPGPP